MNGDRNYIIAACDTNTLRGYYAYMFTFEPEEVVTLHRLELTYLDMDTHFGKWLLHALDNKVIDIESFRKIYEYENPSHDVFDYIATNNFTSISLKLLI
jgi:hypothetical protein